MSQEGTETIDLLLQIIKKTKQLNKRIPTKNRKSSVPVKMAPPLKPVGRKELNRKLPKPRSKRSNGNATARSDKLIVSVKGKRKESFRNHALVDGKNGQRATSPRAGRRTATRRELTSKLAERKTDGSNGLGASREKKVGKHRPTLRIGKRGWQRHCHCATLRPCTVSFASISRGQMLLPNVSEAWQPDSIPTKTRDPFLRRTATRWPFRLSMRRGRPWYDRRQPTGNVV